MNQDIEPIKQDSSGDHIRITSNTNDQETGFFDKAVSPVNGTPRHANVTIKSNSNAPEPIVIPRPLNTVEVQNVESF